MTIYAGSHYSETIRKAESLQRFNNDDGTIAHVIKFEGKHRLIDSCIVTKEEYERAREKQEKRELAESLIKQGTDILDELEKTKEDKLWEEENLMTGSGSTSTIPRGKILPIKSHD